MAQQIIPKANLPLLPLDRRRNLYDLSPADLSALLIAWGEPAYRTKQVLHWLYKELASDFGQMGNLPAALRSRLAEEFRIGSAEVVAQKISSDGWTRKGLLKMRDGNTVEAVLMLYYDRATVCVSSQVGCAMGCGFCATGQMGFTRNLTQGEIVEQTILFNRWLREHPHQPPSLQKRGARYAGKTGSADVNAWHVTEEATGGRDTPVEAITNIVFMGMGEPLLNYKNLWGAIRLLNSPQGLGLGARRLTVSTVGIAPQIRRFAREDLTVNLAVSLHAPNNELRSELVPMNRRYPVEELIDACRDYLDVTRRRITFEYVLISGVNDGLHLARELSQLLKGMLCHVNLIPLNPVPGTGMSATPREQVFAFQRIVEEGGISTTVRIERGADIAAACGQLKVEAEGETRRRTLNPDLLRDQVQADLAARA